jgi:TM2 domain-containing membrane protein YozV
MVFCRACGKEIHETAPTCPHCGAPQPLVAAGSGAALRSQTVAVLWCAFLGAFGAHRFYLGKVVSGVLYLLFCWTSIPSLIAFVEAPILAFSSPQTWATRYNGGRPSEPTHWAVKVLSLIGPILIVLGILSAIAIPAFNEYSVRARTAMIQPQPSSRVADCDRDAFA